MNKPDENRLNSWLEGELEGEELRKMEAWAVAHLAELDDEFKSEIGWSARNDEMLKRLPSSEEPPYPEFFNHKILQSISEESEHQLVSASARSVSTFWQKLRIIIAPAAIAALVSFYAGTQLRSQQPTQPEMAIEVTTEVSSVYVPIDGIAAKVSESGDTTEIVLSGLEPIADELDIVGRAPSSKLLPMTAKSDSQTTNLKTY